MSSFMMFKSLEGMFLYGLNCFLKLFRFFFPLHSLCLDLARRVMFSMSVIVLEKAI